MSDPAISLEVTLLGRPYRVACKESERKELLEAVGFLESRMRQIRDAGRIAGVERLAVMAALNIAHDHLKAKASVPSTAEPERRIVAMRQAIDKAMAEQERLF